MQLELLSCRGCAVCMTETVECPEREPVYRVREGALFGKRLARGLGLHMRVRGCVRVRVPGSECVSAYMCM